MRVLGMMLCATVLFGAPAPATAQEVQVAFDDAGRIERIDAELARRLGLFLDRWPELREVRLFSRPDGRFVL